MGGELASFVVESHLAFHITINDVMQKGFIYPIGQSRERIDYFEFIFFAVKKVSGSDYKLFIKL